MNAYEEMLNLMRSEGSKDNTAPIQIGVMQSETSCKIGNLELEGSDLLTAGHLRTGYDCKGVYVEKLKKGDTVALYRVNEEQYIILERLV